MQLYFAFGSNMDGAAMARRCPRSRLLGPGCLAAHRFALMGRTGYATIRTDPRSQVFGLVFEIDDGDEPMAIDSPGELIMISDDSDSEDDEGCFIPCGTS